MIYGDDVDDDAIDDDDDEDEDEDVQVEVGPRCTLRQSNEVR